MASKIRIRKSITLSLFVLLGHFLRMVFRVSGIRIGRGFSFIYWWLAKINSLEVDVYDLCSDDLRVKLEATRKKAKKPYGLKDLDVKMSDVEEESSDASGDSCRTTCEEGVVCEQEIQLTGVYHLVAFLALSKDPRYGGNYSAFKARKKSDEQELTWYHCTNESHYAVRQEFVKKVMSGGAGCEPYICLYKAEVVN